ncbi:hypothetical protein GYMLUDRAFT_234921 [Collybiopsis luxurians FD-317 M1]|nr:hypothetical protein GYMLUDRAFT_234921 [Collybiopsis luxurians FD-317 M1]
MSRPNRRSALEVSFQDEFPIQPQATTSNSQSRTLARAPQVPRAQKRKLNDVEPERPRTSAKKRKLPPTSYFDPPGVEYMTESANMRITGEDDDMDLEEGEKPIRNLFEFTIFDPEQRNQVMSLDMVDDPNSQLLGFGKVSAYFENEEEEGQEADIAGEIYQWVRFGPIKQVGLDYDKDNSPLYIETDHSWYLIQMPSLKYTQFLFHFYFPHRLAQMVISSALSDPRLTCEKFQDRLQQSPPFLEQLLTVDDLNQALPVIQDVAKNMCKEHSELKPVPIIKFYLKTITADTRKHLSLSTKGPINRKVNVDLAVLRVENQTQTTVTPLIGKLSQRYVRENLRIIGPRPSRDRESKRQKELATQLDLFRKKLLENTKKCQRTSEVDHEKERGSDFAKVLIIDGTRYEIGDTVLVLMGDDPADSKRKGQERPSLLKPTDDILRTKSSEDYFWFARIVYVDIDRMAVHVQWFNHGKSTVMKELCHPQELFLQAHCGPISVYSIVDKVKVHYLAHDAKGRFLDTENIPLGEYFCKFEYEPETAVFTTVRDKFLTIRYQRRVAACPVCDLAKEMEQKHFPELINDKTAIAFRGHEFHVHDFVLYLSPQYGPGCIGQFVSLRFPQRDTTLNGLEVVVKKVGRITSLKKIIPEKELIDERELFIIANEDRGNYDWIDATSLIQVVHVMAAKDRSDAVENWILHSSDHFYVRYYFPSLDVESWDTKKPIKNKQLSICIQCRQRREAEVNASNEFVSYQQLARNRPRALDVFGGSGALGIALAEGSSFIDVTHAIEIAPSAARTYKKNSPDTAVHNICVNDAVQYLVKQNNGIENPQDIPITKGTDEREQFSLKPQDVDVIVAGFPCQPHSTQNIYKDANDAKTNLILPLLSLVDHLRPYFIVIENVLGFIFCRLMSKQKGPHRVEGGIKQGALKLLIRALIEMGYQVRFSLLQAAHYGTPQGRVRFFLLAALPGFPLPEFPQPTHYFPLEGVAPYLRIQLDNERTIAPIPTARGTMLFPTVTIADAISDLRRFDWKHPQLKKQTPEQFREASRRARTVPAVKCKLDSPWWGLEEEQNSYEHPCRTRFQLQVRRKAEERLPQSDIQHYTRKLPLRTVERVVNINLAPDSDFQNLPSDLAEFQYWNPASYVARSRTTKGLYKRLNPENYFMTTVTNISPTAKQSAVINPFCRRLLTVRELLRSQGIPDDFVVCAIDDNVITMVCPLFCADSYLLIMLSTQHRAIGNAVPWQLSLALGQEMKNALQKKWQSREEMVID